MAAPKTSGLALYRRFVASDPSLFAPRFGHYPARLAISPASAAYAVAAENSLSLGLDELGRGLATMMRAAHRVPG
jgi:hypothetical protein